MNYIKKMAKRALLVALMVIAFINLNAQNCFENLGEVSGIDMSQYSSELDSAACALIETLPINYQTQFKVFDFGFYSLEESMYPDENELWTNVISSAQSKSPYYLLIGKVSGASGIYKEYLIDLKLPPIFDSECADVLSRKVAEIQSILDEGSDALDFAEKEIDAMETLQNVGNCEICDDEIDNDGDGFIDCDDFDCLYLQIASQLKDDKESSENRSGCTILTLEELDLFVQFEEHIVSLGHESSAEVMEEIAAAGVGSCLGAALISILIDYGVYYLEGYLTIPNYPPLRSMASVDSIFSNHGLSILGSAALSCAEGFIPVTSKIRKYIKLSITAAEAYLGAFENEFNVHAKSGFSTTTILREKMDWGAVLTNGSDGAIVGILISQKLDELGETISDLWIANKGRIIDRFDRMFRDHWHKFKEKFELNPASGFESAIRTLRGKVSADDWEFFLDDFGNVFNDISWFLGNSISKIKAWKEIFDFDFLRKNTDAVDDVSKALDDGLNALDAVEDAIERSGKPKPTWDEIKSFFKRGNDFNRKARTEKWYDFDEIHLANGKRLDSYDPDVGEIVSRKATDFNNIQSSTFENYLKEIDLKYAPGTIIRSNKYPSIDGQPLQGIKIIEVPDVNQNSPILATFQALADQYNTIIRFRPE